VTDPVVMEEMLAMIAGNDGPFKFHLDRMKYSTRYAEVDPATHRHEAVQLLKPLETRLQLHPYLFGDSPTLADIAIFPFVRQFAHADAAGFTALSLPRLQHWLRHWEGSPLFASVMSKHPRWQPEQAAIYVQG